MPPEKHQGQKIVRSYAGQGTAETIYVTEDGTHWTDDPGKMPSGDMTAGPRIGRIIGGRMFG